MRNYKARIQLAPGKWAFEQHDTFADAARIEIRKIAKKWSAPSYFYHLQKGGHVAAVRSHLNNHYFGKIDLRRFFEQVTRNRVIKRLMGIGFSRIDAQDFAVASTILRPSDHEKFVLPYGFVQSPLLASLDLDGTALGRQIAVLNGRGYAVSAYVDDIVVSGADEAGTSAALQDLRKAAEDSLLLINEEKSAPVGPSLTAFNIDFRHGHMEITAARLKEFDERIHIYGPSDETLAIYGYVRTVNSDQAAALLAAYPKQLSDAVKLAA